MAAQAGVVELGDSYTRGMHLFNGGGGFIVWGVFVSVAVGVTAYIEKKRREAWEAWARSTGWRYTTLLSGMVGDLRGGPFGRGRSRNTRHVVRGTYDGLPAISFHYRYTTGSGKNRTTHHHHVCAVTIGHARFPLTELSRENWATRMLEDFQFEDARFNNEWRVTGQSRRFAHDLVHPRAMEWLMGRSFPSFETMWFEDNAMWISRSGSMDPDEVGFYLEPLVAFAQTMPRFLVEGVGGPSPLGVTPTGFTAATD